MDHQDCIRRHHDPVGATYRYTACTGGQGVDTPGTPFTQAVQRVVNGKAFEQVATVGVERHHHR